MPGSCTLQRPCVQSAVRDARAGQCSSYQEVKNISPLGCREIAKLTLSFGGLIQEHSGAFCFRQGSRGARRSHLWAFYGVGGKVRAEAGFDLVRSPLNETGSEL